MYKMKSIVASAAKVRKGFSLVGKSSLWSSCHTVGGNSNIFSHRYYSSNKPSDEASSSNTNNDDTNKQEKEEKTIVQKLLSNQPRKETWEMIVTLLALLGGTLFFTSDYFLDFLVRRSMKWLGWDAVLDYESITGCFFCGSMKVHQLKVNSLQINSEEAISGHVDDLFLVVPWYLLLKERIQKYFNSQLESVMYLPRFVAIGGNIETVKRHEDNKGAMLPQILGFDNVVIDGMGVFDMTIKSDTSLIKVDRFEIFDTVSFQQGNSNFFPFALRSKGKFFYNDVVIRANIFHDDTAKSFNNESDKDYWTWVHENEEYLNSQWCFGNIETPTVTLLKHHPSNNTVQIQTHIHNHVNPHTCSTIPLQQFTFSYLNQHHLSPLVKLSDL